jgi:hypothetical protein
VSFASVVAVVSVVSFASNGTVAVAGARQGQEIPLRQLTVPTERLPQGCGLAAIEPIEKGRPQRLPAIDSNPWFPSAARDKLHVYRMLEGPSRVIDGPPLTAGDARRFEGKLSDDIEEAYHAVYAGPPEPDVRVWALRYARPPLTFDQDHRPYRIGVRYTSGRTVAAIEARGRGPCFDAVNAHVRDIFAK